MSLNADPAFWASARKAPDPLRPQLRGQSSSKRAEGSFVHDADGRAILDFHLRPDERRAGPYAP